ncbi:MAG: hypothetical protein ACKOQ4_11250 [Mycobacterium sp.]
MKRAWPVLAAAVVLPAALALSPGAGADPGNAEQPGGAPAVESAVLTDLQGAPAEALPAEPAPEALPAEPAPEALVVAPAAHVDFAPELLPPGVGPEQGLQVRTILAERNISTYFPQITEMIGVRPDSKPWHPNGLALDVIIPDAGSAEGIALGDAIRDYALRNADRFGLQDVIWRGVYYTPAGPGGSGYGHFDHVHITTTGGGYPGGVEEYPRVAP